jgi:hypothetical protein
MDSFAHSTFEWLSISSWRRIPHVERRGGDADSATAKNPMKALRALRENPQGAL